MEQKSESCAGMLEEKKNLTKRQIEYLDAYIELGTASAVGRKLGVANDTVRESLGRVARAMGLKTIKELLPKGKRYTRASESRATTAELMAKIKKQDYRCAVSGVKLEPSTCALDHIVPVSSGGGDAIDNLQWVASDVNKAKGAMSVKDFVAMCKRVAAWSS